MAKSANWGFHFFRRVRKSGSLYLTTFFNPIK